MKKLNLILSTSEVGYLASTVALQDGKITLQKDKESSFYIANIEGDDITIPENMKALEIKPRKEVGTNETTVEIDESLEKLNQNALKKSNDNSTDLILRLHLNQAVDPAKINTLYNEIAKAIESVIKKID
jgi:hypothetical protein